MPFNHKSVDLAIHIMNQLNPALSQQYATIIQFLSNNPDAASSVRGKVQKLKNGSEHFQRKKAIIGKIFQRLSIHPSQKQDSEILLSNICFH